MRKWSPAVLIVATLAFSAAMYNTLPERMVIHWSASGEPNGYASRAFGAFFLPAIALGIWGLLSVVPKIDPRGRNIEQFRDSYEILVVAVIGLLCLLHVGVVGSARGWPIRIERLAPVGIGALFLILGVLLPRFRSNFFLGIRTPWTLSSETVWARTHRVGGYAMAAMGILFASAGLVGSERWFWIVMAGSVALALGVLVFSYVAWRQEQPGR